MTKVYNELIKCIDESRISLNEPMRKHTSFKIGGPADIFVRPKDAHELISILKVAKMNNVKTTVIGNGSNILVKDRWNKRNSYKARF